MSKIFTSLLQKKFRSDRNWSLENFISLNCLRLYNGFVENKIQQLNMYNEFIEKDVEYYVDYIVLRGMY